MSLIAGLSADVRQYLMVTLAYWAFTLTDGALRMLVLLYFYRLGYSPFDVALLFVLYEVAGIVTNLAGGWLGARFGLRQTLFAGMALQIVALMMLTVPDAWLGVVYVMLAQALSGVAKDLTKMSAKSNVKLLVREGGSNRLFRWVAALTGSKNALKGLGFFIGSALLVLVGFRAAMIGMAVWIAVFLLLAVLNLYADSGRARQRPAFSALFSSSTAINRLAAARFFLFGARDIWFVVALPVFLQGVLGWGHLEVGSFMAIWIMGYGLVQTLAPRLLGRDPARDTSGRPARFWGLLLSLVPPAMIVALWQGLPPGAVLIGGLGLFGALFAINSSVHSWLILEHAREDGVSLDVGFYYMANAAGRLAGTLLSGLVYQAQGMIGCLTVTTAFAIIASLLAGRLPSRGQPDVQS